VVGGAVLWSVAMRLFSEVFVIDYAVSVLTLNALINIHHYVLDGAIWKLRDGRIARLLVSEEAPKPAETAAPALPRAARWGSVGRGVAWAAVASVALAMFGTDTLRGYMLLQAGSLRAAQKWQDAEGFYHDALRFNGRTTDAMEGLAVAEMQAGNFEQALQHWAESVRLNPISAHLRDGLGETYLRLGRLDDALEQLEEAVLLAPKDEVGLRLLAQAHWAKGDRAQARTLIERADTAASEANRQRLAL
jgi:tetratricopeptide (TPR) repeat protein